MSPVVRISDSTYERLKSLAEPFTDTPDSTIARLLSFYERHKNARKTPQPGPVAIPDSQLATPLSASQRDLSIEEKFHSARSAREVIQKILITFAEVNPEFLERFAAKQPLRKRRFIARSRNELYPGRPDLAKDYAVELIQGWWMGTNYSRESFKKMARLASEVVNVEFGKDLIDSP